MLISFPIYMNIHYLLTITRAIPRSSVPKEYKFYLQQFIEQCSLLFLLISDVPIWSLQSSSIWIGETNLIATIGLVSNIFKLWISATDITIYSEIMNNF